LRVGDIRSFLKVVRDDTVEGGGGGGIGLSERVDIDLISTPDEGINLVSTPDDIVPDIDLISTPEDIVPDSDAAKPTAKPTAGPRKGAEHGVASTTASNPSKKLRRVWLPVVPTFASEPVGAKISKTPNKFNAKTTRTAEMAATKIGSWNWKPHPMASPPARIPITAAARTSIELTTPAVYAAPLARTSRRSL
jgi:hypothetical protein